MCSTSFSRTIAKAFVLAAVSCMALVGVPAHARNRERKYTPPPPTATIKVTVVRSTNGKPIANAAVIFHPMKNNKDSGALELKSDPDGQVKIDVIPVGDTVRLQVIADGWQTYGQDYDIQSDSKEILVKMKRPPSQYSIYNTGKPAASVDNTAPKGESNSAKPSPQTPLPQ